MPKRTVPFGQLQEDALRERVREEYETTDLSLRELAKRNGIKSTTTIVRWIAGGGWKRDADGNQARIIAEAVKGTPIGEPDSDVHATKRRKGGRNKAIEDECAHEAKDVHIQPPPKTPAKEPQPRGLVSQRIVSALAQEEGPDGELEQAASRETIQELHARTTRRHLRVADQMACVGRMILSEIEAMLSEMPGTEQFAVHNARLGALGGGTEKLSGLMKGVAELLQTSVTIERRAMGQETNNDPLRAKRDPGGGGSFVPASAASILEALPDDVLLQVRQVAITMASLPPGPRPSMPGNAAPPVIDGQAAAPKEG